MPHYILKHPSPDHRGFAHGVDFYGGIGSTSSMEDRDFLVDKLGCEQISPKSEIKGTGAGQPAPVSKPQSDAAFYRPVEVALAEIGAIHPTPSPAMAKAKIVAPEASQAPKTADLPPKGKPGRKPKAKR